MPATTLPLTGHWVIANNRPVFYRAANVTLPGASPIVHVHGFGISGRYLVPTAERLAPFYPTYVPDLPGFGHSPRPPQRFTIPELARELAAFMDAAGIERAVLLGNSLGCLITLEFANAFPDRVERTVLVSPSGGDHNQPLFRGLFQLGLDALLEPPGLLPIAISDYLRFGVANSLRLFRAMSKFPITERSMDLDLPTLVVLGTRDPLISRRHLEQMVAEKPNMTLVLQDRAAHAINFSHPGSLATVVRSWLNAPNTPPTATIPSGQS